MLYKYMKIKELIERLSNSISYLKSGDRDKLLKAMSRREMITGGSILGASALLAAAPSYSSNAEAQAATVATTIMDCATSGNSFRTSAGLGIEQNAQFLSGEGFIVKGILYKGNTISATTTPDSPGRIGTWNCFGIINLGGEEGLKPGPVPPLFSTQVFLLDTGDQITTIGGEYNIPTFQRSIVGGTGDFLGITGIQEGIAIGVNPTSTPNYRFTLRMIKQKIKNK